MVEVNYKHCYCQKCRRGWCQQYHRKCLGICSSYVYFDGEWSVYGDGDCDEHGALTQEGV